MLPPARQEEPSRAAGSRAERQQRFGQGIGPAGWPQTGPRCAAAAPLRPLLPAGRGTARTAGRPQPRRRTSQETEGWKESRSPLPAPCACEAETALPAQWDPQGQGSCRQITPCSSVASPPSTPRGHRGVPFIPRDLKREWDEVGGSSRMFPAKGGDVHGLSWAVLAVQTRGGKSGRGQRCKSPSHGSVPRELVLPPGTHVEMGQTGGWVGGDSWGPQWAQRGGSGSPCSQGGWRAGPADCSRPSLKPCPPSQPLPVSCAIPLAMLGAPRLCHALCFIGTSHCARPRARQLGPRCLSLPLSEGSGG